MSTARKEYFLLVAGLALLIITGAAVYYIQRAPNRSKDMAEVSAVVTSLGAYEKSVSLQEEEELLKSDIQASYGQFVTDSLLQAWRADPKHAPGRLTSSPWPDRIEIDSISPQGAGYIVSGRVIMMTSTGESGQVPVVTLLVRENGKWKIAVYQEAATQVATN